MVADQHIGTYGQYDLFVAPQVSEEWTRGRSRRLPIPPTPREVVSLHSDYNPTPKTQRGFRGGTVVRRISPVGHEKIIRGTGDPDEKGKGLDPGGCRDFKMGSRGRLSGGGTKDNRVGSWGLVGLIYE